jgi:integrase
MPIWKDPKTGRWRYQFQHLGQRHSKTGFDTLKAAKAGMAKRREELETEARTPPSPPMPSASDSGPLILEALMVKYLRLAERSLAEVSLKKRKAAFRRFLDHVGTVPVAAITTDMVEDYLLTRSTNSQYNKERTEIMCLFRWAHRRLLISTNPVLLVDKVSWSSPKKVIPTPEEMARILLAAGKDRPFILVLFHTLGRIDEVLRLKWDDINWERREFRLWTRKRRGGNWQYDWLPMNEDLEKIFRDLYRKRTQDEWVFLSPRTGTRYMDRFDLMRRICQRAKVPRYTYHTIRHFVASYLYDKKKRPIAEISKLLRHTNYQTTERYLQLVAPHLRDTMRLLEGDVVNWMSGEMTDSEKPTHHLLTDAHG